jgi:RNA recognition motif-containing protein
MGKIVYVGNLESGVTSSQLTSLFAAHGMVEAARIVLDKDAGCSKGFGFVKMKTNKEAQTATAALNGKDWGGSTLIVRPKRRRAKGGRNIPEGSDQSSEEGNRLS